MDIARSLYWARIRATQKEQSKEHSNRSISKRKTCQSVEIDSHTNAVVLKGSLCWTPFSQKFHKRDALMDVERGHPRHKMDSQAYSVLHYGSLAHTKWTHKYETVSI